jgi:Family of unknown function (DUF6152)
VKRLACIVGFLCLPLLVAPAYAHHSFSAFFDADSPVDLTGTITALEWANPHVWFYLDVVRPGGQVQNWGFEMGSPNGLVRQGWSRDALEIGREVRVVGFLAKDGTLKAAVRSVTLPSGERLSGAQNESN